MQTVTLFILQMVLRFALNSPRCRNSEICNVVADQFADPKTQNELLDLIRIKNADWEIVPFKFKVDWFVKEDSSAVNPVKDTAAQ